jgi:hypothetical protein
MRAYRVTWQSDAEADLAEFWSDPLADSAKREAIRFAADTQELVLAKDPKGRGSHLSEGLWAISHPPLRLIYVVDDDLAVVDVVRAKLYD